MERYRKPEDLIKANQLLLETMHVEEFVVASNLVAPEAHIEGAVSVGEGTKIGEGVKIVGPVVIGEHCVLEECVIGPNVSLGSGSNVRDAMIRDSIVLDHVTVRGQMNLADCLIGKYASVMNLSGATFRGAQRLILGDKTVVEW